MLSDTISRMTDEIFRTQIRFPAELAASLKRLAKDSDESFNGEVVRRLEISVNQEPVDAPAIMSAKEALKIAQTGLDKLRQHLMGEIMALIQEEAQFGRLKFDYFNPESRSWNLDYKENVIMPVAKELVALGFGVTIYAQMISIDAAPEKPFLEDDPELPF